MAAAATFVWKKEAGRDEEGRSERLLLDVPRPRDPLRLAPEEPGPRPVVQVEDEPLRLLRAVEEGAQGRLERRVVARRDEHRDRLLLVAARAHDHVAGEAVRADAGRGDGRGRERVAQGEGDAVGSTGVHGALLDRDHVVRPAGEVAHDEAARAPAEDEGGLLPEAPGHAVAAHRHPDRGQDPRGLLAHRLAQQHVEVRRLLPQLLRVRDVLPGAAAARVGVAAAGHDAVGRRLLHLDDPGEGGPPPGVPIGGRGPHRAQDPHAHPLARDPAGHDEPARRPRRRRPRPTGRCRSA